MINIEVLINADLYKTWEVYTEPNFIIQWNFANSDWHCPKAENQLEVSGKFTNTMAAKDAV